MYIFDPTITDSQTRVRGVGRYIRLLQEALGERATFTNDLKKVPYDSVFLNPFFDPIKSPLTLSRISRKQIAVIHDLIPLKYPDHFPIGLGGKLNVFLNKIALKNYDFIITDSQTSKQDIVKILKVKFDRIHVVYPILSNIFKNSSPAEQNTLGNAIISEPYCLYVGDATWNKNLVNIAKAIQMADMKCVFAGKVFEQLNDFTQLTHPWQSELKTFLEMTKNDERFIFPGYVSDEKLQNLYKHAQMNILVSRDEGFGFSYLEASNYKIASVLSDTPILKEISDGAALFANPEQPEDIAQKIKELMKNENLRNELGEKAYIRSRFFSFTTFQSALFDLLQTGV